MNIKKIALLALLVFIINGSNNCAADKKINVTSIVIKSNFLKKDYNDIIFLGNSLLKYGIVQLKSKFIQNKENKLLKAWNGSIKIGSIPIFNIPYFNISTDNHKYGHLLLPAIKYSNTNGFELSIPYQLKTNTNNHLFINYYLNTKEHFFNIQSKLDYICNFGQGLITFNYPFFVQKDYNVKNLENNLLSINHLYDVLFYWNNSNIYNHWKIHANYFMIHNKYDINVKHDNTYQGDISYVDHYKNFFISLKQNTFSKELNTKILYRENLQMDLYYHQKNILNFFDVQIHSQIMQFNSDLSKQIKLSLEPILKFPLSIHSLVLNNEIKISAEYNNDNLIADLAKKTNFFQAKFSFNMHTMFDHKIIINNKKYEQIFKSDIEYVISPYPDNRKAIFKNYNVFESDNKLYFIKNKNENLPYHIIKFSLKTNIYDSNFMECFHAYIHKIYSYNLFNKSIYENNLTNEVTTSMLNTDLYLRINNNYAIYNSCQYSFYLHKIVTNNILLQYCPSVNNIIEFSYQYHQPEDFTNINNEKLIINPTYGISQLSVESTWLIFKKLKLHIDCYYDIYNKILASQSIGLNFVFGDYNMQLNYIHKLNGNNHYSNNFSLNIKLN
ncbi:MAG: LPS assembly protein LptD [Pantoea sp. Brub]|nr:LPS assembly protein LptD [Pantoea sp. Brub]